MTTRNTTAIATSGLALLGLAAMALTRPATKPVSSALASQPSPAQLLAPPRRVLDP